ncbi:MAG: hypothetical protein ACLTMP_09345 [Eggerthella lenta]
MYFGQLDASWMPNWAPMQVVYVHKDISEYEEKVVGKLSARVAACVGGIAAAWRPPPSRTWSSGWRWQMPPCP